MNGPGRLTSLEVRGLACWVPEPGADVVQIDFPHAVTAIVGGNGSGKSSVAAALRMLALGESPRGRHVDDAMSHASGDELVISGSWSSGESVRRAWTRDPHTGSVSRAISCSFARGTMRDLEPVVRARLAGRVLGVSDAEVIDQWAPVSLLDDGPRLRRKLLARFGGAEGWTTAELLRAAEAEVGQLPSQVRPLPEQRGPGGKVLVAGEVLADEWIRGATGRVRASIRELDEAIRQLRATTAEWPAASGSPPDLASATKTRDALRAEVERRRREASARRTAEAARARTEARRADLRAALADLPVVDAAQARARIEAAEAAGRAWRAAEADRGERLAAERELEAAREARRQGEAYTAQAEADLERAEAEAAAWKPAPSSAGVCPTCGQARPSPKGAPAPAPRPDPEPVRARVVKARARLAALDDTIARASERLRRPALEAVAEPEDVADARALLTAAARRAEIEGALAELGPEVEPEPEPEGEPIEALEARLVDAERARDAAVRFDEVRRRYDRDRAELAERELQRKRLHGWIAWLEARAQALLGEVRGQIEPLASRMLGRPVVLDLSDDPRGNASCVIRIDGVPISASSDGEQLAAIAAITAASMASAEGWRLLVVDRIESIDRRRRPVVVASLVEAARRGLVDQVVLLGCPETWTHVDGCDLIDLGME